MEIEVFNKAVALRDEIDDLKAELTKRTDAFDKGDDIGYIIVDSIKTDTKLNIDAVEAQKIKDILTKPFIAKIAKLEKEFSKL